MAEYSADAPLSASTNDKFHRWPFASRIAQVIASRTDPESIVIGINGAWGEGKTTVFNFIQEALLGCRQIVCFRFNPWRFPDENKLIRDFFQSLAEAVDAKLDRAHEKIGAFLGKYIAIPAGLAGAGDAVKAVGDILSTVELEKVKNRVEKVLRESGKRVVVLMDDIDRLDKNEIQTVFRLVKLVADFQNTAYVLAFDAEMVASALQERYSSHDPQAGRNFLEKIIQVPLDLPHIPGNALREFCLGLLQGVVNDSKTALSEDDVRDFVRGFDGGLLNRLQTPRMAKRYANILAFALPILKDEVHPVDLMLIEGIRVFYPVLYDRIRNNIDLFIPTRSGWTGSNDREVQRRQAIETALESVTEDERNGTLALLKQLFPMIAGTFGGVYYAEGTMARWTAERRVTSRTYFQRYFSYAIPEGQISDREIAAFLASLIANDDAINATELKRLVGTTNAAFVIGKLRAVADTLEVMAAEKLAFATVLVDESFPNPEQQWKFVGPFSQAAMLVSGLIGRVAFLAGQEEGCSLALACVEKAESVKFAEEMFRWIGFEKEHSDADQEPAGDSPPDRLALPQEDRKRIGGVLLGRIKNTLSDAGKISAIPPNELVRYLCVWAMLESQSETAKFVATLIDGDASYTLLILDGLRPIAWNMMTGIPRKSEFGRDEYNTLIRFADPALICQSLETPFGPYQMTEDYPRNFDEVSPAENLANQFFWIHNYVLKEAAEQRKSTELESKGELG
jgi:hypothetical protein